MFHLASRSLWVCLGLVTAVGCGGLTSDDALGSQGTGGANPGRTARLALGGHLAAGARPGGDTSLGGATSTATGGARAGTGGAATGGKMATTGAVHSDGGVTFRISTAPLGGGTTGGVTSTSTVVGGDVCLLRPDPGDCLAAFSAYYFDPKLGSCESFMYGGCGGNDNRFATLQQCQQRCQPNLMCPLNRPSSNEIVQCSMNSVCYYDRYTTCACQFEGGFCGLTDIPCDPSSSDDADAGASFGADAGSRSTPVPNDAGADEIFPSLTVCTCGSYAWTCRPLDLL